jgi:DNA polymerase elongation subunit (family B)
MTTDNLYTFYKTWGSNILLKYRKNGKSYAKTIDFFKPSLYTKSSTGQGDAKSIYGYPLKQTQFDCIRDAREFVKTYKDVDNFVIEGNSNYANQFIIELNNGEMPQFDPNDIRVGILDIEVRSTDGFPEPAEAKWPINGVTFYDSFTKTYYCIGDKLYIHDKTDEHVGKLNVQFILCDNEVELLKAMLNHFREFQYDLTAGWNSESFDMPYIVNRCFKVIGKKFTSDSLSPFGKVELREIEGKYGKTMLKADITGLPHTDYMQLYMKHIHTPRESYKLDFIASAELGMNKLSYEEEGSLANLYDVNPQKFYTYNIIDVDIIRRLDEKLGLFNITYTLAYYCLSNFEDTLGTTKIWEQLIAKHLYGKNMVPSFKAKRAEYREFDGAFVHPTQVGYFEWIESVDLNSLYPMNEIQYNIGPNTHIPRDKLPDELLQLKAKYTLDDLVHGRVDLSALKKYNYAMAGNFEFYDRSEVGFMAEIKDALYTGRKVYKKKMLAADSKVQELKGVTDRDVSDEIKSEELKIVQFNNLQMALKILLNAGYGAVGNQHFLYYKVENAEAITASGQLINKWTHVRVNALLNKMLGTEGVNRTVAGDTDSLYLNLSDVVKQMNIGHLSENEITDKLDQFTKTILSPKIDKFANDLCDYVNGMQNKMVWEREVIAPQAIFVRKKGYIMNVLDSEGVRYNTPKFKVTGLEAVKSSTPEWSRVYLKECYKLALAQDKDALHARVKEIRKEFGKLSSSVISIPRGTTDIDKYIDPDMIYIKGTPKHVKAALIHNWYVDKLGLKIPKLVGGNKLKYVELKKPNPINQEVVGFEWFMPPEFNLDDYVDRDGIFKSAFLSPLQIFLDSIKWTHEPVISLESFFG